jgi:hypothetical protein
MIRRLDLLTLINIGLDDAIVLQRISDLGDAIGAGHLLIENDGDEIVGLSITTAGRALIKPTLPWTSA